MRLLLVEDNERFATLLKQGLAGAGFAVDVLPTAKDARSALETGRWDIIVLDRGLPDADGLEVLRDLPGRENLLVIFSSTYDHYAIRAFEAHALDYLVKPFGPDELMARIRAILRRTGQQSLGCAKPFRIGRLVLNPNTREVRGRNGCVEVTSIEFDILELLIRNNGRAVTRNEISAVLYQREASPYERTLDVHISHLRKKVETEGASIRTVRGVGYLLAASD